MIQFWGIHIDAETASVVSRGRDLRLWARSSTKVVNAVKDAATGSVEVPVGEWTRAGEYALQEAYFQLPVAARKVWGVAFAGPSGWIALDVQFEPISPLRLVADDRVFADFDAWREANPRPAKRIAALLCPKDYLRFSLSRGLAIDVATASRLGLLRPAQAQWSPTGLEATGVPGDWFPPVFDGHVTTGTISEEGIRRTSLPGGTWFAAGAHETEAAVISAGDVRDGRLWAVARAGKPTVLAIDAGPLPGRPAPAGWRAVRSPIAGHQLLEKESDDAAALDVARRELEAVGIPVAGTQTAAGDPAEGAAALAAIGSGLIKGWDRYYRERVRTEDEAAEPAETAE